MESLSSGLRGTSYPGSPRPQFSILQGLYQLLSVNGHAPIYGVEEHQDERAATPSGLMRLLSASPRVARSSQPWAERCNPFGIERHGLAPQRLVALGWKRLETCATTLSTALSYRASRQPLRA